jgi:hypothetical protein
MTRDRGLLFRWRAVLGAAEMRRGVFDVSPGTARPGRRDDARLLLLFTQRTVLGVAEMKATRCLPCQVDSGVGLG